MACLTACRFLLVVYGFSAALAAGGVPWEVVLDGRSPLLNCGPRSLQFLLPLTLSSNSSFTVILRDKDDVPVVLQNDTECGIWVSQRPGASAVIGADYAGCYVSEQDGQYILTLDVEESFAGENVTWGKKLKCPVLPVMDAPSPNTCAAVDVATRLLCGSLPITQEVCEALNCCYDPRTSSTPCYFGNPVTAHCSPTGQATIAISTDVTRPSLDLNLVRLLTVSSSCSGLNVYRTYGFVAYQFPLICGDIHQVKSDTTVYENRVEATRNVLTANSASISRDTIFRLTVRCTFTSSSSFIPLQVEVFTLPPPPPVSSPGPLLIEMRIAKDQTYSSYYSIGEYPVLKVLQDPVFVEVRILQRTDSKLMLVLNQCWATPSSDANQPMHWPILVDRCPYAGDNYKTLVIPVRETFSMLQFPSHYQRFVVATFTFVDNAQQNMRGPVFFHCAASVCAPSAQDSCSTACPSRKRRMIKDWESDAEPMSLVTAEGPVIFFAEDEDTALAGSRSSEASLVPGWARMVVLTVGLLVFIAVVCLAVAQLVGLRKHHDEQVEMAAVKA